MKKRKFIRKTTFFALMLAVLTVSLLTACKSKETVVSPADLTKEEKMVTIGRQHHTLHMSLGYSILMITNILLKII